MKKHHKLTAERVILLGIGVLWTIICLFPLWHLFSATFSSDNTNITTIFLPIDFKNGISKITYAFTTGNILNAIVDTGIYSLITIIGLVFISALVAYEFTFYEFPFK